jgi:hypothetical protein
MSATESDEIHLQEKKLTGTKIKTILTQFALWLKTAKFDLADPQKSEGLQTCTDPGLGDASQPLLLELGVYDRVNLSIQPAQISELM